MRKVFSWIKNKIIDYYDQISNIVSAILSIILSLLANYIYDFLCADAESSTQANYFIITTLVLFVIVLIVGISLVSQKIKKYLFRDKYYNEYIQKAYFAIQDLSKKNQEEFQNLCEVTYNKTDYINWLSRCIQISVEECYNFFYNSFGSGSSLFSDTIINFEVTYMTLSYKDGKITIPSSCNYERRKPTSMLMRDRNPDIYCGTVTAEIYNEYNKHRKPSFRIIESTQKGYKFIYDNQNQRIKSSIVLPVLSHKSELLGTIVVHCNKEFFFSKKQRKFWYEIMQLFALEIGTYKLLLNYIVEQGDVPF
ncbi:MAG: hypothetical protein J6D21_07480 [Clostridia bacterium]|nr:hypothetical protein [Clostridia bacterium]